MRPITVSAPGKVMVSGEYVVLDGAPAIVAAAPARAIVRLSPHATDGSPHPATGSPDAPSLPPDAQEPAPVDPGDAATAGADGGDVDRRNRYGKAELNLEVSRIANSAAADQADVATRAPHVEGHKVLKPDKLPEEVAGDQPAGQAGEQQLDRLRFR